MIPAQIATTVPRGHGELVARLGSAMRGHGGERHRQSLWIAGALLQSGVDRGDVPAIVEGAAAAAGWADPAHHRVNAEDTVRKHEAGNPVRADIPPAARLVLDELVGAESEANLADEQGRLRDAIENAPDGLSTVGAPCGLGKTWTAENVAHDRASADKRTVISVPTNALAAQVTDHLRSRGVATRRVFGPAGVSGPDGCKFPSQAKALASAKQSVRLNLCERPEPCRYLETCRAAEGADGPADASVVVGNHGLLGELASAAGARGLLVIDEPPPPFADVLLSAADLAVAKHVASAFENDAIGLMPALEAAERLLASRIVDVRHHLGDDLGHLVPAGTFELADAVDIRGAAFAALRRGQLAPQIERRALIQMRHVEQFAADVTRASHVFATLHWAATCDDVRTVVTEHHATGERRLAFTGLHAQVQRAITRRGRTVITAADVELYADELAAVAGYDVPHTKLVAPDGTAVRRVLIQVRTASRGTWLRQGRKPRRSFMQALDVARMAGGRIAVVTFKALESWVRAEAPGIDVGHFGALRGLDHWKGHDALITLGDPIPNLSAVERTTADDDDPHARAELLARAELEQAHGRLRVVHRSTPCTMIHVGRLLPAGWREPVEVHAVGSGPPPRSNVDLEALRAAVAAGGGPSRVSAALHVSGRSLFRWLAGKTAPPRDILSRIGGVTQLPIYSSYIANPVTPTPHSQLCHPDTQGHTGAQP